MQGTTNMRSISHSSIKSVHRLSQLFNKSHPLDNVVENTRAGAASVALIIHTAKSEARITPRENLGFSGCRMARYLVKRVEFDVYEICAMNPVESAAPRSQEPISSIDRTAFETTILSGMPRFFAYFLCRVCVCVPFGI